MPIVVVQPKAGSNPCASCKSLYGATCCESKGDAAPFFPLTYAEARRIAKYHGMPLKKAVNIRMVPAAEQKLLRSSSGTHISNLIVDNVGLYLPLREDGSCQYLGKGGCLIPFIKPYICAMFPFSRKHDHWVIGGLVHDTGFCFGQDASGLNTKKAMDLFGETKANLDLVEKHWLRDRKTHAAHMKKLRRRK